MSGYQRNQVARQGPSINHDLFASAFNEVQNCKSFEIRVTGEGRSLNQNTGVWENYSPGLEINGETEEVARKRIECEMNLEIDQINNEYYAITANESKKLAMAKAKLDGEYMQRITEIETNANSRKRQLSNELKRFESTIEHDIEKSSLEKKYQLEMMRNETQRQAKANETQVNLDRINTQRQSKFRELNAQKGIDIERMAINKELADIENNKDIQISKEYNDYMKTTSELESSFNVKVAQLESQKLIAIANKQNERKWYQFFH